MGLTFREKRPNAPLLGFELIDVFARDQKTRGPAPGPTGAIRFEVLAEQAAAGLHRFAVPLEMIMRRNASGVFLFTGRVREPGGPEKRLPSGRYQIRIAGDHYQALTPAPLASEPGRPAEGFHQLELQPSYAYPFLLGRGVEGGPALLRGSLHLRDGRPLADAELAARVPRFDSLGNVIDLLDRKYATDASGQWALNFPPDVFPVRLGTKERQPIDIDVTIRYPDATPVVERVQLAPAAETRLGETALRGRVQTTAGRALAGAVVTIGGFQGTSTTDAIGHYTYFFPFGEALPGSVTVTATLPDGRQRATPASVELRQTKPVPTLVFN